MVLAGDVTLASRQVQSRDVVSTISVLELDCASSSGKGKELMAKANTENWNLRGLHESTQMVDSFLAMRWVTRAIGDEHTVKVVSHLVDGKVIGKDSDTCASSNQTSQDILLDTTVDHCHVHIPILGANVEGGFGADLAD